MHREQAAPFVPAEIVNIQGNHMHEQHFADGVVCGECHLSTEPMPVTRAHEVCVECHPNQAVSKPVWLNHCLACHHFTKAAQEAAGDPEKLTQALCVQCHKGGGPGGMIFAYHYEPTGHKIVCSRCHRPHEKVEPASESLCLECHPELAETWHPTGEGVKCAICHEPHRKPPEGDTLCTQCHGQPTNIPVHEIPEHPKDCLACHTAHFNTFQLKNGCADCHSDASGSDLLSQTAGHSDCSGCHRGSDFTFKGNGACASCHKEEGSILGLERVPEEHQYCRNCHEPHTWRASFTATCKRCHQSVRGFEHQAAFHPKDCSACHDAHLLRDLPASGDCSGCHTGNDRVPAFGKNAPMPHTVCANCHADDAMDTGNFTFVGEPASCRQCHSDAGNGRSWDSVPEGHQTCSNCHPAHTWHVAAPEQSCNLCHGDVAAAAPSPAHQDCFSCHATDHGLKFAGVDGSCAMCHAELPGAHSAAGHSDCITCHSQHSFVAGTSSCLVCHADKAEGHHTSEGGCTDCHSFSG